jgi:hypothetical protein
MYLKVALSSFLQNTGDVSQFSEETVGSVIVIYMSPLFCERGQLSVAQSDS